MHYVLKAAKHIPGAEVTRYSIDISNGATAEAPLNWGSVPMSYVALTVDDEIRIITSIGIARIDANNNVIVDNIVAERQPNGTYYYDGTNYIWRDNSANAGLPLNQFTHADLYILNTDYSTELIEYLPRVIAM